MDIHIFWEGPFELKDMSKINNESKDYGIYQVYGHHPIYGDSVLLYIGLAVNQTFATRIAQETWNDRPDPLNTHIYIGRLAGRMKVDIDTWDELIERAEKLLIYSHKPVLNTQNTKSLKEGDFLDDRIYNWGSHRDLFPEVSTRRFISSNFEHISEDQIYDASKDTRVDNE